MIIAVVALWWIGWDCMSGCRLVHVWDRISGCMLVHVLGSHQWVPVGTCFGIPSAGAWLCYLHIGRGGARITRGTMCTRNEEKKVVSSGRGELVDKKTKIERDRNSMRTQRKESKREGVEYGERE